MYFLDQLQKKKKRAFGIEGFENWHLNKLGKAPNGDIIHTELEIF